MTRFGPNQSHVEELQRLSEQELNQANAQEFLVFLDRVFPNKLWEQHDEPRRIVERYLERLDAINAAWSREITEAIQNSNTQRTALASSLAPARSLRPQARPQREATEAVAEHREFPERDLREAAQYVIQRAENGQITTQGDREVYLFQSYVNQAQFSGEVGVDGIAGEQTKNTIRNNVRETQIFLRELGVSGLSFNGVLDATTIAAIEDQFGINMESVVATAAVEAAQEGINALNNLSTEEVVQRLSDAESITTRNPYISLLSFRFKRDRYIISPDDNNEFKILDASGDTVPLEISQENLGAIMILMSVSSENIIADMLDRNIGNNIFDAVVAEFDFKKENGQAWRAQDFLTDDVRSATEVEANKTACVAQINQKITTLRTSLGESSTTETQKTQIRMWIQKLEIAKIFIRDQSLIPDNSLQIAHNIAAARAEVARLFGRTPQEQARIAGQTELGDIRSFMIGQTPRLIIAGLFALLAKLLPSPFKEAAWAWIAGITGLGIAEDAQNRGLIPEGRGNLRGINTPDVRTPGDTDIQDTIRNILTNAPTGLEARHETIYARLVQKNTEGSYITNREHLDTTFLFLSQDYEFGQKSISELDGLTDVTVWGILSEYSKAELMSRGITGEEVLRFIQMLKSSQISETNDTQIEDLFIVGQVTDTVNRLDITWVQGNVFTEKNSEINSHVSQISGISYGAPEALRTNSIRAEVERALALAQPGVIAWLGQAVAERTSFVGDQVPTAENIGQVLSTLRAISATGDDQIHIAGLIAIYEEISDELSQNETIHTYLAEASAVYTFTGSVARGFGDIVFWVQGWGDTIPVDNRQPITIERIDELITTGEAHATSLSGNPDLQRDVITTVENLRLYKIKLLDEQVRNTSLTPVERDRLRTISDTTLTEVIEANPEVYITTLNTMRVSLAALKSTQTNTVAYQTLLNGHVSELSTLQRLARITTGNTSFDTLARQVYDELYTNGIESHFRVHLSSNITALANFSTAATTLAEVNQRQAQLDAIRNELISPDWGNDIRAFFGSTGIYSVVPDGIDIIFGSINPGYTPLNFDETLIQTKQTELDTARLAFEGSLDVTVTAPTDTELLDPTRIARYVEDINAMYAQIQTLSDAHKATKLETLRIQVSDVIDRLTVKLNEPSVGTDMAQITPITTAYNTLITSRMENAENTSFEAAREVKTAEVAAHELEQQMQSITIAAAGDQVREMIAFITTYKDYSAVQTQIITMFGGTSIDDSTSIYSLMQLVDVVSELPSLGDDLRTPAVETTNIPTNYRQEGQTAINRTIERIRGNTLLELSDLARDYILRGHDILTLLFS